MPTCKKCQSHQVTKNGFVRSKQSKSSQWKPYCPARKVGKLCYHLCTTESTRPVRDVQYGCTEPNYETATYNWYARCNQPSVHAAVQDRLSHILFVTEYQGTNRCYVGHYFIVGYYELGWTAEINGRTAIRAKNLCFVPVEHAYEITDERWQFINPHGETTRLTNLRWATQRISGNLLDKIVQHLDKHNRMADYLLEVARLKAKYNPFEDIPKGRIFIINVGANTSHQQQSPLFDDGTFEFMPIPGGHDEGLTYADLRQFNDSDMPLFDRFAAPAISPSKKVHNDPEFATFTYGDNLHKKGGLRRLQAGDFLFFLARLVPYTRQQFDEQNAIFALIGYLEIEERLDNPDDPMFTSPAFNKNAHVMRWVNNPASFTDFAVFKGSINSRRFHTAVPFDRKFVEHVPILKKDRTVWKWGQQTDLGVIGSNTRAVRMHIDPKKNKKRAKRFWKHIWKLQSWS